MVERDGLFRDTIVERLREDLLGPSDTQEILTDRPTQRYSTGLLYPLDSYVQDEEDQDSALVVNQSEDTASEPDTSGVPLHAALKPSTAGLSFAVAPATDERVAAVVFEIRCATYERFTVDEDGRETEDPTSSRSQERWRRVPHAASVTVELAPGEFKQDLGSQGMDELDLYVLVSSHARLLTVTAALSNKRTRGDSRVSDEAQHFFQVELSATTVRDGSFAPRPSRRAETDDDSRSAALIYRDAVEYVVGHGCSARTVFASGGSGALQELRTEWIPTVTVPATSDQGDGVFEALRESDTYRPFDAVWLAEASEADLVHGLDRLVEAYREWITREERLVGGLPITMRPQAGKHLDRCKQGADRMAEGVSAIRSDAEVRSAFQLSQRAMSLQFAWQREGAKLVWRPFQLGFQLLVLTSLSSREHSGRGVMDLLWFPTGGGKTEAYLSLTAFAILLRRLRSTEVDDGAGVVVLMRYTLRLLTVQQFQRATAMILACELLRRQSQATGSETPGLGRVPIGIGLWVGSAATPNSLQDAVAQSGDSASTHRQIVICPACGETLKWTLTRSESSVRCESDPGACEFAGAESLPIWTIDEEIYRRSPSLVIGTIDKFAQIVRNMSTSSLFGTHANHAPPDLIIQDELHLISGPLGSIAGLYEVAIDELCRRGTVRPKIIGSTATIRRAEDQIQALFDRETYQFPSPGLSAGNSGFAVVGEGQPGRLYVGLTTAGRSATYMLQALAASLLQAADDPGASPEERDLYWTLVIYFNSIRELGHALLLMQDDVPVSIGQLSARRGEQPREVDPPAELTSRVGSYQIRDMLARLDTTADEAGAVDLLLASNMISVGMDVSRLGLMVVNAQPKTLSEYIQATSRVGRGSVPGVIITMYNNMRARDRSHYETFETWHRSLYRDIEATSVTPFASRAQDKAIHAVLVALTRHRVPGMADRPILDDLRRPQVEQVAALIEERVARVDRSERLVVSKKLKLLIDEWASRDDLQTYWDDYQKKTSLLLSAEQFAATLAGDADLDAGGVRRALWPTPNSMRDVEPGTPFVLRQALKAEES